MLTGTSWRAMRGTWNIGKLRIFRLISSLTTKYFCICAEMAITTTIMGDLWSKMKKRG